MPRTSAGVPVIASMADEASKHPNLPGSLEHTLTVNSVTTSEGPTSYLALNGCTNYGGRTFLSIPSGSCSSEATGIMSGVTGLLVSEARAKGLTLSTNEILQLVRANADDVDFSTPNAVDPANDFLTGSTVRYPTRPGWDATDGYGRLNAYELLKAVRDAKIPPEADLTSPRWFSLLPGARHRRPARTRRGAARAGYSYRVEWATGVQPPAYPGTDVVARGRREAAPHPRHRRAPRDARPRVGRGRARWRDRAADRSRPPAAATRRSSASASAWS